MITNDLNEKFLSYLTSYLFFRYSPGFHIERIRDSGPDSNNRGVLRRYYFRGLGARDLQNQTPIESHARYHRAANDDRYTDRTGDTNAAVPGNELAA